MALRVLLADESSTIKKVMQLALSDFGVEVKTVPVGLDVLSVTKTFKPDIIFADVLLPKRTGYDVCADIKSDSSTMHIPFVLMWSGFMEIDETKASACQADRRLEKPFDADILRNIVTDLVKKSQTNPISDFLSFPEMPEFEEPPAMSEMDEPVIDQEEFAAVPLTATKMEVDQEDGGWAHQDLSKFKLHIPETDEGDFASKFIIPQPEELSLPQVEDSGEFEEITFAEAAFEEPIPTKVTPPKAFSSATDSAPTNTAPSAKVELSESLAEKIIREEAREIIESICWRILPEIAERVVREEINKILKETEI